MRGIRDLAQKNMFYKLVDCYVQDQTVEWALYCLIWKLMKNVEEFIVLDVV